MTVYRALPVLLLTVCAALGDICEYVLNKDVIPECWHQDVHPDPGNCIYRVVENRKVASCFLEEVHYVPVFPFKIDSLCLVSTGLLHTDKADFFANVSSISALVLFAEIDDVHPTAFRRLQNLTRLSVISYNRNLRRTDITHILEAVPVLTEFGINGCHLKTEAAVLKNYKSLQNLEFIDMSDNSLKNLNLSRSESLQTVRRADFGFNLLSRVNVFTILPRLEEFILAHNLLQGFPVTCTRSDGSYFPSVLQLDLQYNKIHVVPGRLCLPRLQVLVLDGNNLIFLEGVFRMKGEIFPSLVFASFVNVIDETMSSIAEFKFSDMPSLECVRLSRNLHIDISEFIEYFVNCSRFRLLDISENKILNIYETSFPLEPQLSMQNVEFLNLSSCGLGSYSDPTTLPMCILVMPNLVSLDISSNNLHFIPSGLFDGLLKLRHLDLSLNFLTVVSPDMFSDATRGRLQTLDFSGNLFECSCDNFWFKSWIASSPSKFVELANYWCVTEDDVPNRLAIDYKLSEQACLMSHAAYVAITYVTVFTLLFAVISVSFWRYKWHLRLLLYDMFRGPGNARRLRLQHGHFDYDVFVSYDSDDQLWVFGKLLPELEGRLGLKLCVHERDFVPGTQIIDNIGKCVEASKKILMVWSRNFVDSKWCQFELTYCLQHTMDTEDALVIVCLDDVTSTNDVTTAMMAVLKTTTYIQWVGERRGQAALDSFWGRLRVALQEVIPEDEHRV